MNASSGTLDISLAFITDSIPEKVPVEWELFNEQSSPNDRSRISFPLQADSRRHVLVWKNYPTSYAIPQMECLPVDSSYCVPSGSMVMGGLAIASFAR